MILKSNSDTNEDIKLLNESRLIHEYELNASEGVLVNLEYIVKDNLSCLFVQTPDDMGHKYSFRPAQEKNVKTRLRGVARFDEKEANEIARDLNERIKEAGKSDFIVASAIHVDQYHEESIDSIIKTQVMLGLTEEEKKISVVDQEAINEDYDGMLL